MRLELTNPKVVQFIKQSVKAGDYPSPEAAIEDAVARMMEEDLSLSDEDIVAIKLAEEQFDRGEGIDFEQFEAELKKKYGV
jgi:Arc/MetJ-type ribon-helix-helix transcriptional regulator